MKKIFGFILSALLISACSDNKAVTGYVENLNDEKIYIEGFPVSPMGGLYFIDSIYAKNGKFHYAFANDSLFMLLFYPTSAVNNDEGFKFVNQNKVMTIFAGKGYQSHIDGLLTNEYLQYRVTGNDLSTDYADLNNTFRVNNAAFFNNCDSKLLSQGLDSLDRENIFDSMEECYKKLDRSE